jgi:hypothetical protein
METAEPRLRLSQRAGAEGCAHVGYCRRYDSRIERMKGPASLSAGVTARFDRPDGHSLIALA